MPIPPLRARIIEALEAAGYRNREDHLPTRHSGGTFSAVGNIGVYVTADWWGVTDEERAALLAGMAEALREEGLEVEDRGDRLYVPYVAAETE